MCPDFLKLIYPELYFTWLPACELLVQQHSLSNMAEFTSVLGYNFKRVFEYCLKLGLNT